MPGELNFSRRATTAGAEHFIDVLFVTGPSLAILNSTSVSLKMGMSIVWTISEMMTNLRPHERTAVLRPSK